jgi:hypothetical protein
MFLFRSVLLVFIVFFLLDLLADMGPLDFCSEFVFLLYAVDECEQLHNQDVFDLMLDLGIGDSVLLTHEILLFVIEGYAVVTLAVVVVQ